jgi:23S rRNA G2069 N7-methylase RlmK/C1962 C5-methylase RlmI
VSEANPTTPNPYEPLANRLRKRFRHLRKWARRTGASCYRLYERDLPDHPLVVDWYDGEAVVWTYERKRDETPEAHDVWRAGVVGAVQSALDRTPEQVFVKHRERQKGAAQYERVDEGGHVRVVEEHGLRFEVNLSDYLDTGLFLDHRPLRARVREEADGKDVLNLFAYTGSFSVYAAAGGARRTRTVDMSRTYCEWAQRNLALNGFSQETEHRVLRRDCLEFLEDARERPERYDLIVCDPPTFSNSKRMQGSFSVQRDARFLLDRCNELLRPGGVLYFSTNDRRFSLPEAAAARFSVQDISERTIPEDFRNRRIHACWQLTKGDAG